MLYMALAALTFLACAASSWGAILQVSIAGADTGSCVSAACGTIKYAISQASTGDTIELGAGTFTGAGNRNIEIGVQQGASPQNLKIKSSAGPGQTVIDIEKAGRGFKLGQYAGAVVVEGITVIHGDCSAINVNDDRNGAGFHLQNSQATVRNVRLENLDCTLDGIEYKYWSGAAFYLKDSNALIDGVEVVDAIANHGGGVAAWGDDQSQVKNSVFLRGAGTMWGGCMLMEENVSTLFENVRFSYSACGYGAAMDDGSTAHPTYRNCIFEYGEAIHGGAIYHYGTSYVTFEGCTFQHNIQNSGAIYVNAGTRPSFKDCLFYNNTSNAEAGAIRSYYTGGNGPIVVERTRFILNTATMYAGAVSSEGNFIFRDSSFESNSARETGGAMAMGSADRVGLGLVLNNVTFKSNTAQGDGGAVGTVAAQVPQPSQFTIEDCTFEDNSAQNGGAMSLHYGTDLKILRSRFSGNKAKVRGGTLYLGSIMSSQPLNLVVNDSTIEESRAASGGGAIFCNEPVPTATTLEMNRFTIKDSQTYLAGGGLQYDCSKIKLRDGTFQNNQATEGNGGAIVLSKKVKCEQGDGLFSNVAFHNNVASEGGGLLFFDHLDPKCKLPLLEDGITWNSSSSAVWSWSNFNTAVQGNDATYGKLQATAPSEVGLKCSSGNGICSLSSLRKGTVVGYPNVELELEASLIDDFGSSIVSPGLQIEVALDESTLASTSFSLNGAKRRPLEDGVAQISKLFLIGGTGGSATVPVIVRIPRGLAAYQDVKPASVDVQIGSCGGGFFKDADAKSGALMCSKCPSGKFSLGNADACLVCDAGKYARAIASTACSVCPAGHGCPPGTTEPVSCNSGFFQNLNGSEACSRCLEGSYQDAEAQTSCISCPATQTTKGPGSVKASDCGCAAGSYVGRNGQQCNSCPEGMTCVGFAGDVLVQKGYYSKEMPADPSLGLWRCSSNAHCVGQTRPSDPLCAPYSEGLNCGVCAPGSHRMANGTCDKCKGSGRAVFPVFVVCVFILCGVFHYCWNHRYVKHNKYSEKRKQTMLAACSIGITLCFVQQVGILERLNFNWPEEFEAVMGVCSLLLFDLRILNLNCLVDESFAASYLVGLATPWSFICCFLAWFFLSKILSMVKLCPQFTFADILNSCGMFAQALYISVVSVTVGLFQCYASGPDDERVMTKYSWEKCYESEWMSMLPFAIIALLVYVLGFFALNNYLITVAPSRLGNKSFRRSTRYLVTKFRADTWWYGTPFMLRAVALAMVAVVAPDDAYVQFFLMIFILMIVLLGHLYVQPYAELMANRLETFELCVLITFLVLGVWFIEERDYSGTEKKQATTLSVLMCTCFGLCVAGLFSALSYAVYTRFNPDKVVEQTEKKLIAVIAEYTGACEAFLALDEASKLTVMWEVTYVDLDRLQLISSFLSAVMNGTQKPMSSIISSKSRLSDPGICKTLSQTSQASALENALDKLEAPTKNEKDEATI